MESTLQILLRTLAIRKGWLRTNSYHRTTIVRDEKALEVREKKARGQEAMILDFFKAHKYEDFTPTQIHVVFGQRWPITSVRRAMTNLTKNGFLIQLDKTRPGLYGMENHCWKWNNNETQ